MKLHLSFLFFASVHFALFSQIKNDNTHSFSAQLDFNSNPVQIYEQNGIRIIANLEKCNEPSIGMEKDYIFFNFENTNDFEVKIEFNEHLYYDLICRTCENSEYHKTFNMNAGDNWVSNCQITSQKSIKIFHGSPWVNEKLSKFELVNIKIEKQ